LKKAIYILIALTLVISCKKPYNPVAISSPNSYLVVEGVINSGAESTIIKLSRTVNISSKVSTNPVLNAVLTVESDQNKIYVLTEAAKGSYVSPGLNLDNTRKYRLRIKTADNQEYLSDFVEVVNAPPIDTVGYTVQKDGVQIYSGTHDPKNSTRYYKWSFEETWIFHSRFESLYVSDGDTVTNRPLNAHIYKCWGNDVSSTIILGSSAKLTQDVITGNPITFVSASSEKFTDRYSILVKQYGLTKEAYSFWENLKKNTEQLGSIFDAQPSQLKGNIHAVSNSSEPVIGYISAGAPSSKRIFIDNRQLPALPIAQPYPDCKADTFYYKYYAPGSTTPVNQVDEYINYKRKPIALPLIPIVAIQPPASPIIGFTAAYPECVDCTLRGTNIQPAFWK
jgi:hypothetical protein